MSLGHELTQAVAARCNPLASVVCGPPQSFVAFMLIAVGRGRGLFPQRGQRRLKLSDLRRLDAAALDKRWRESLAAAVEMQRQVSRLGMTSFQVTESYNV